MSIIIGEVRTAMDGQEHRSTKESLVLRWIEDNVQSEWLPGEQSTNYAKPSAKEQQCLTEKHLRNLTGPGSAQSEWETELDETIATTSDSEDHESIHTSDEEFVEHDTESSISSDYSPSSSGSESSESESECDVESSGTEELVECLLGIDVWVKIS